MGNPGDSPPVFRGAIAFRSCSDASAFRLSPRPALRQARIAGPSFVWPAHIGGNCLRLRPLVDEVGLLFFQSEACLAYTETDLPLWLAGTGLRFHVHLPLDMPWKEGLPRVWDIVSGLRRKAAFLQPWAFVLHPPEMPADPGGHAEADGVCPSLEKSVAQGQGFDSFTEFVRLWNQAGAQKPGRQANGGTGDLLLENIRGNDLVALWPLIQSSNLGICLDLGHLLAYGQQTHCLPGIWSHVRMLHLSAPGRPGAPGEDGRHRDGHRSLAELDHQGRALLEDILGRIRPDCVLMLEVFEPEGFMESLNILRCVTDRT